MELLKTKNSLSVRGVLELWEEYYVARHPDLKYLKRELMYKRICKRDKMLQQNVNMIFKHTIAYEFLASMLVFVRNLKSLYAHRLRL